ncbi:MAG: hypothetical protein ACREIS_08590 [Nitrospiraceae bacterium]
MIMQSARSKSLSLLSLSVVVALFLCQVIGALCVMVPLAVGMPAAIHDAQTGHVMGDASICSDSLTSSAEQFDTLATQSFSLLEKDSPLAADVGSQFGDPAFLPDGSDPPLYTLLLNFRI